MSDSDRRTGDVRPPSNRASLDFHRGETYRFRLKERRRRPTPLLSKYTLRGRRRENRRNTEGGGYYVDRLEAKYVLLGATIIALGLLDATLTLVCLRYGLEEANPFMARLLHVSPWIFIVAKFVLTTIGSLFLVLHQKFRYIDLVIVCVIVALGAVNANNAWLLMKRLG